jgi:hypothetical protein
MMKAKHDRLPTNALILASRSGFTPEALNEASSYGIPTFSLAEIDEADFPKLLGPTSSLWTKSVTVTAERVLIRVLPTSTLAAETVPVVPDNLVYSSDGTELCRVSAVVEMLLKSSQAREYLLSEGKQDHVWFEMELKPVRYHLDRPLFLKKIEPETLREIESIQIKGPCKFQITEFALRRGKLDNVHLAWGKTEILGHNAMVVATKDTKGIEKLSITVAGKPRN